MQNLRLPFGPSKPEALLHQDRQAILTHSDWGSELCSLAFEGDCTALLALAYMMSSYQGRRQMCF